MARRALLTLAATVIVACGPVPALGGSPEAPGGTAISNITTTSITDEGQVCSGLQTVKDLVHEIAVAAPDLSDEVRATASESESRALVEQANAAARFIEESLPEMRAAFDAAESAAGSVHLAADIGKLRELTLAIQQTFIHLFGEMTSLDDLAELEERYAEPTSFAMLVVAQGQAVEAVDEYLDANCGFTLAGSAPATATSAPSESEPNTATTVEVPMTQLPDLLRLGGRGSTLGNSCDPGLAGCGVQPGFWINISGKWLPRSLGDAYSAACIESLDRPDCADANDQYRERGYLYGVEANGLPTLTIDFSDLAFANTSGGLTTDDFTRTGDRGCEDWGPSDSAACGPTMLLNLYAPGADPLELSGATLVCSATIPPVAQVAIGDPYVFASPAPCFTVDAPEEGTYVLEVRMVDPGAVVDRSGLNRFSLRSSEGTRLFGIGDMSIYADASVEPDIFLAEVPEKFGGNTFTVELFDAGEVGTGLLQIVDPRTNEVFDGTCHVSITPDRTAGWTGRIPKPSCEQSADRTLNGTWLRFQMELPADYSCGTDCWWKLRYDFSQVLIKDSFTWHAYLES